MPLSGKKYSDVWVKATVYNATIWQKMLQCLGKKQQAFMPLSGRKCIDVLV